MKKLFVRTLYYVLNDPIFYVSILMLANDIALYIARNYMTLNVNHWGVVNLITVGSIVAIIESIISGIIYAIGKNK